MKKNKIWLIASFVSLILHYAIIFILPLCGFALRAWAQTAWLFVVMLSCAVFIFSAVRYSIHQFKRAKIINILIGIAGILGSLFVAFICLVTMVGSLYFKEEEHGVVVENGQKYVVCYAIDEPYGREVKYRYINWFVRGNDVEGVLYE